jgi:hypothetical protein
MVFTSGSPENRGGQKRFDYTSRTAAAFHDIYRILLGFFNDSFIIDKSPGCIKNAEASVYRRLY